jgi:hypothetical protein
MLIFDFVVRAHVLQQTSQKLGTAASSRSLASAAVAQLQRYPDVILHAPETEVLLLAARYRLHCASRSYTLLNNCSTFQLAMSSSDRYATTAARIALAAAQT